MTGQENKSKMGPIECSGGSENRVLSPAEVQEVGHTVSDWDSGNTGSLVITLVWPVSPEGEEGAVTHISKGDQVQ